jgi:hypothetical protein
MGLGRRMMGAVLTVLAATAVSVGATAPAQAGPGGYLGHCYFIDGQLHCDYVAVNWDWRWECPQCGVLIDYGYDPVVREDVQAQIDHYLGAGLQYLGQAATGGDPALRSRALDQFTTAARLAGGARMHVKQVGVADAETGKFDPEPAPWLQAAGADLTDGVGLLQQALADPAGAARLRSAAAAQFDEAYNELAGQKAIGQ